MRRSDIPRDSGPGVLIERELGVLQDRLRPRGLRVAPLSRAKGALATVVGCPGRCRLSRIMPGDCYRSIFSPHTRPGLERIECIVTSILALYRISARGATIGSVPIRVTHSHIRRQSLVTTVETNRVAVPAVCARAMARRRSRRQSELPLPLRWCRCCQPRPLSFASGLQRAALARVSVPYASHGVRPFTSHLREPSGADVTAST